MIALAEFLLITIGGGLLIGFVTRPGAWYAGLAKPPFNPPNWIFAPVWTLLYVLIAIAGARTYESGTTAYPAPQRIRAMALGCSAYQPSHTRNKPRSSPRPGQRSRCELRRV